MSIPTNAPSASSLQNQSVQDSLMAATSSAVDRLVLSVRDQQAVIQQLLEVQSERARLVFLVHRGEDGNSYI